MQNIEGREVDTRRFGSFTPDDVLYEFDGPRIFTLRDADGELYLAYWSDNDDADRIDRYVVAPTSSRFIEDLKQGNISVYEALNQPHCWLCDVSYDGEVVKCLRIEFSVVPHETLPSPGTMLWPSLEPIITVRAVGKEIQPGQIPGSVIRNCVEGVQRAFKVLAEFVLDEPAQAGRPKEFLRRLFDLPAQRLAFGSLEVSFRMPIDEQSLFSDDEDKSPEVDTLEAVGRLLSKGLLWINTQAAEEGMFPADDHGEAPVVLRALKELTPSTYGSIEKLEVSGALLNSQKKSATLTTESRRRVNAAIRNIAIEPQIVDLEGRIRELDKDRLSFWLREIEGGKINSQQFVFSEELREEVFQAFEEEIRVKVAGETYPVRNLAYALALSRMEAADSDE